MSTHGSKDMFSLKPSLALSLVLAAPFFPSIASADEMVRFDGDQVVRVKIDSVRALRTMLVLSPDCWSESIGLGTLDFRMPADRMAALEKSGIPFGVLIPDLQALLDAERTRLEEREGGIAGADFFTTEVWTVRGLVTYYTLFVIDLASRRVQILGSTRHPDALFMHQTTRALVFADDGTLARHRVLICDRDAKWTRAV